MIINTANHSRTKGTAYELAKAHVADKIAENEKKTTANEESEVTSSGKQTAGEPAAAGKEKTEEAKLDVFLSSLKEEKGQETLFATPSKVSSGQPANDSGGFQMRSSAPEDSVGQLAAMLARAETKLDVLQVSGKAMRALVNLKASAATAKGDDAKKLAAKIKRMEKLMKRIEKKLKHLDKEENMEREQKRAVEKQEKQKAERLEDELRTRRKKRRRDEKNYADKELAEDEKEANAETMAALSGLGGASAPSLDAVSGMDAAMSGDVAAAVPDATSLDITV